MKAFLISMVALIVITVGANLILTTSDIYTREEAQSSNVRLSD